jgi:hypothetical protein
MPNRCKWVPILRKNCKMGSRFLVLVTVLASPVWKDGDVSSAQLKSLKEW